MNSTAQKCEAISPEATQLGCDKANICNQRSLPSSLVFILLPCVPYIKIVLFVTPLSLLAKLSYLATLGGNSFSLRFPPCPAKFLSVRTKSRREVRSLSSRCRPHHRICLRSFAARSPRVAPDSDVLEGYKKPHLIYAARCQHPGYVSVVLYVAPVCPLVGTFSILNLFDF